MDQKDGREPREATDRAVALTLFIAVVVLATLLTLVIEGASSARERWPYALIPAAVTAFAYLAGRRAHRRRS